MVTLNLRTLSLEILKLKPWWPKIGLIKTDPLKNSRTEEEILMVLTSPSTNMIIAEKMVTPKPNALNSWGFHNSWTTVVIRRRKIPRWPPLLQLLKQRLKDNDDVTRNASALVAAASNGGKILNKSASVSNSAWIIDSGATDHMTLTVDGEEKI